MFMGSVFDFALSLLMNQALAHDNLLDKEILITIIVWLEFAQVHQPLFCCVLGGLALELLKELLHVQVQFVFLDVIP